MRSSSHHLLIWHVVSIACVTISRSTTTLNLGTSKAGGVCSISATRPRAASEAILEMGRGRIGILRPNLLPAFQEYREKLRRFDRELNNRRRRRQQRPDRPSAE